MKRVIGQRRSKQDVSQQYRNAHIQGAPVVELFGGDAPVEEIHQHHHHTSNVEYVEHQLRPCLLKTQMHNSVYHGADRDGGGQDGDNDIENVRLVLESYFHSVIVFQVIL